MFAGWLEQRAFRLALEKLAPELGPVHLVSDRSFLPLLPNLAAASFTDVREFHPTTARKVHELPPLDEGLLDALAECRPYVDRTLDRVFLSRGSHRRAERYYHDLVSLWHALLERTSPRALVFAHGPHFPWDLVGFFVATARGTPVWFARHTIIDGCLQIHDDFRPGRTFPVVFDETADFLATAEHVEASASAWRMTDASRAYNAEAAQGQSSTQAAAWAARFTLQRLRGALRPPGRRPEPAPARAYLDVSGAREYGLTISHLVHQLQLRRRVSALAGEPDLDADFVYFALHAQPERTTDPEAGHWSDQELAVRLLAAALPAGWRIVVKDHPRQLRAVPPAIRQRHYRDTAYYDRLASIPSVTVVSPETSSQLLIDRARVVASCTGSVLWEAASAGTPAVSFGSTWHDGCPSTPRVSSVASARSHLAELSQRSRERVAADARQFLRDHRRTLVRACFNDHELATDDLPEDAHARNLANAFRAVFAGHGPETP